MDGPNQAWKSEFPLDNMQVNHNSYFNLIISMFGMLVTVVCKTYHHILRNIKNEKNLVMRFFTNLLDGYIFIN